jgi:hypothetical protein
MKIELEGFQTILHNKSALVTGWLKLMGKARSSPDAQHLEGRPLICTLWDICQSDPMLIIIQ